MKLYFQGNDIEYISNLQSLDSCHKCQLVTISEDMIFTIKEVRENLFIIETPFGWISTEEIFDMAYHVFGKHFYDFEFIHQLIGKELLIETVYNHICGIAIL